MTSKSERKTLISNILSLVLLQGVNYLLPLLTIPFLVRVLGVEQFGLISFVTALIMYFVIITDYGFNLTATSTVTLCRNNSDELANVVSEVFWVRILLSLLCLVVLSLLLLLFPLLRENWISYYLAFGIVIGNALMPVWLFQGLEKMAYITGLNIFSRCTSALGIFMLIQGPEDYSLVLVVNSLGYLLAGFAAVYIQIFIFKIPLKKPLICQMMLQLKGGLHVFLSSVSISFYTVSSSVILGLIAGNVAVGYFSAAEKLISAFKGLSAPVMQAIFPAVNRKIKTNRKAGFAFVKKVGIVMSTLMLLVCLFIFLFASSLVELFLGDGYEQSILLVQVMSVTPLIVLFANILGIQLMLPLKLNNVYSKIYLGAALFSLFSAFFLVSEYSELGTAITIVLTETMVVVCMAICLWRRIDSAVAKVAVND